MKSMEFTLWFLNEIISPLPLSSINYQIILHHYHYWLVLNPKKFLFFSTSPSFLPFSESLTTTDLFHYLYCFALIRWSTVEWIQHVIFQTIFSLFNQFHLGFLYIFTWFNISFVFNHWMIYFMWIYQVYQL